MKVQAYKCRFTGKLFDLTERAKYAKHLRELRTKNKGLRLEAKMEAEWNAWLKAEKKKIAYIDQIAPWFLANQQKIMAKVNSESKGTVSGHEKFVLTSDKFLKLEFDMKWKPLCSNSHSAPFGKKTNWCGKDDAPRGYPGWHGRVEGSLKRAPKNDYSYPYGLAYALVGIKTGTGGGGNSHHGYDVTIFLDDWPGLGKEADIQLDIARQLTEKERIRAYEAEQELIIKKLKYAWA